MARFFLRFRLNVYLCRIYPCRKPRKGKSKGGDIYIKGVTVRFGFDVLELRNFKRSVKNKATGTPCGVHIHCILNISCNRMLQGGVRAYGVYTSSWGFRRCSF